MLISPDYAEQNRTLHEQRPEYGVSGRKYAPVVMDIVESIGSKDVLDYGCGKSTLARALNFPIREYDPCIPGKDAAPSPADIVACTDVLEHIEPDCLEAVLEDLARVTRKVLICTVCTVLAEKTLPDGRNAHLIVEPMDWWAGRLNQHFRWLAYQNSGATFLAVLGAK